MTEYMQRTSSREGYENPILVSFKTNLIDKFYDLVGKEMKNVGAHYFGHHLINNHCREGHTVSSFFTDLNWQNTYWSKYWDCDPIADLSSQIAKINGCAVTSWKITDPDSDCMEDRKSICKMKDGLSFWIQNDTGILENFSFGWEKYDISRVNRQKLAKLSNMVSDFRIQHFRLNRDMFETFPLC